MGKQPTKAFTIISIIIGCIFLIGILIFLFFLGKYFLVLIKTLDKAVAAAIIATSGTILTSVGTLIITQFLSKKREITEAHRHEKVKTYNRFMEIVTMVLKNTKLDKNYLKEGMELPKELVDLFFDFQKDLMAWGSPKVIKAFIEYRSVSLTDSSNVVILVDHVLREIRKDLGHKDRDLKEGELISVFLANPKEIEQLKSKKDS